LVLGGDRRDDEAAVGGPDPAVVTLVGRGRERTEVRALLEDARLVTLVGSGGCGKTLLARELCRELPPGYRDGV
jgi:MoxR-like ATPase